MPSNPGDRAFGLTPAQAARIPSAIDGVPVSQVVEPGSPQEAADLLADAADRGLAVVPVGGGTSLALGNPPERVDLVLATGRLGGIIDYEPTDLVLSVGAGAPLGDVQAVLAEHGQGLPIDPPGGPEATIGGLVATALGGPSRLGHGTLRDLLIGIAVAHPSGTVTKAGGMVVKNVTGFDLPRVYHGSLGTLGLLVSANFKVLPLPRADATVLAPAPSLEAALAAAARLRASRLQPIALESALLDGAWLTAVRLTGGRPDTLLPLTEEARALLGPAAQTLDGTEAAAWWRAYLAPQSLRATDHEVLVRCSVRPRDTATLAAALLAALPPLAAAPTYLAASPALGSLIGRLRFLAGTPNPLPALQSALLPLADHTTILVAPPAWKPGLDVWGRAPETLDLMRALKHQFDPTRVLNPGRFAGHI